MRTKISLVLSLLCVPLAFWACDDDGSSAVDESNFTASSDSVADVSGIMVETFDDLPVCRKKREGVVAYVKDEKTGYVCENRMWKEDKEEPASSSSLEDEPASCSNDVESSSSSLEKEPASSSSRMRGSSSSTTDESCSSSVQSSSGDAESSSSSLENEPAPDSDRGASSALSSSSWSEATGSKNSSSSVQSSSSKPASSSSLENEPAPDSDRGSSSAQSSPSWSDVIGANSSSSYVESSSSLAKGPVDPATVVMGEMTDDRDGHTYKTVTIGTQTWMAENLNYAYNRRTSSLDSSSFCYDNDPEKCKTYGRLYLWSAAMDSAAVFSDEGLNCGCGRYCDLTENVRGVCPSGWHLPRLSEWSRLFTDVGGSKTAGTALKTQTGWTSYRNVPAGTDAYGFSVLPAGAWKPDGGFFYEGEYAYFWYSLDSNGDSAYRVYMCNSDEKANQYFFHKIYAYSVRCVKD